MIANMVQYLTDKYPNVYSKGIRCGAYFPDEWLPIIEELSLKISNELIASDIKEFSVDQIKEKFGGLRYYVTGSNEKIDQFIVEAENKVYELEKKNKVD
jgi:hypothetical protein